MAAAGCSHLLPRSPAALTHTCRCPRTTLLGGPVKILDKAAPLQPLPAPAHSPGERTAPTHPRWPHLIVPVGALGPVFWTAPLFNSRASVASRVPSGQGCMGRNLIAYDVRRPTSSLPSALARSGVRSSAELTCMQTRHVRGAATLRFQNLYCTCRLKIQLPSFGPRLTNNSICMHCVMRIDGLGNLPDRYSY